MTTKDNKAMMVDKKRARWILGASGVAVAAALMTQIQYAESKDDVMPPLRDEWISHSDYLSLEQDEQVLLTLDWTPIESDQPVDLKTDRKTKAS